MAYLAKDDYTLHISVDHLDEILTQAKQSSGLNEDAIRQEAEETAAAEITAFLKAYYDIEGELNKSSSETRNRLIKKCMIDISLYHIFFTINPRDIPESREKLYMNCKEMLQAYRDGVIDMGLPTIDADGDGEADIRKTDLRSKPKFISRPFTDPKLLEEQDD